jgi:hypothetical protein
MLADTTQHQLLFCLSAVVPADITLLSNRNYFVLWFSIGFSCQADNYKIPAQQQAVNVVGNAMKVSNKLSVLLICFAAIQFNCRHNSIDGTKINQVSISYPDINGVYIGYEEIYFVDENNVKHQSYNPENPEEKWFRETKLKIKGDSVFADQCALIVRGNDSMHSSSDGGFYYWRGILSRNDSTIQINLTELFCHYCGELAKKLPDGTYMKVKRKKTISGLLSNTGLIIPGFSKKLTNDTLLSENPWPYL